MFRKSFYRRALVATLSILLTAFAIIQLGDMDKASAQSNPGDAYIYAPSTRTLSPVSVYRTVGTVTNANANPTAASPTRISETGSDTYHMWTLVGTWNYYLYSGDSTWLSSIWSKYKLGVSFITAKIDANGLLNVTGTQDWAV